MGKQARISKPPVDPELSAKRRAAALLGNARRWSKEGREQVQARAEGYHQAVKDIAKPSQIASQGATRKALAAPLNDHTDQSLISQAQRRALDYAPHLLVRLGELARGYHKAAPAQQIQASRLLLEVAGLLAAGNQPGVSDAPLNQQTVSAMRQVVAAGEERIRQLQAELDGHAIDGQVGSRSTDPVHEEPPGKQDGGAEAGE